MKAFSPIFKRHRCLAALAAVASVLAFCPAVDAARAPELLYIEKKPVDIKVEPQAFEGKHMKIKDYFGRPLDPKDRDDKKLWRRRWVKDQKIRQKQYLAFFTESDRVGSAMLCYVPRSDKRAVDLVQNQLAKDEPIVLKGRLMAREIGDHGEPDITHFMVASLQRGHEEQRVFFVSTSKGRKEIKRAGEYEFSCPKCGKKLFSVRFHELMGSFDLAVTCPHDKCGGTYTYRFTME